MRVGIGLPSGIPGVRGDLVVRWAERAEAAPFSSLAVIDRVAYDSYDPLLALAAAAAVTRRVKLVTAILVAPLRNTVLLAKELASLDQLSGGRLVVGFAVGAREEDYEVAGVDHRGRGSRLAEQLRELRRLWEEGRVGPPPAQPGGPPFLVGGFADEAFARVARYARGYFHGGGPPRAFARAAEMARIAWSEAGRPGRPELWGQGYFALGEEARERGIRYMRDYYAFAGPVVERIAAQLLTTPQAVVRFVEGYATAGCDELVLLPAVPDPDQVDRLAEALACVW
ncbi:MAG: LLM class flavin-dependent oxidoreductase [Armatimonadota bacterium]|nr:LLM class flavin-dependent oxidoreductase [Armatimonadota bacterium]MDR7439664.1 LLM class flavin-dependent oxidoreductase [Armatimonadota bacterium]MDR7562237.1 LLM class flavin-dependent oxidoreductase [Armatimonadota bacterium]MDR7567078.1 LLM class flavin-dependent oxidoreductase [Armatimonadota bacterium]MDR7602151.1 LLM class flavin-dependent oxidoreductase [Armatimonadota bacterium]